MVSHLLHFDITDIVTFDTKYLFKKDEEGKDRRKKMGKIWPISKRKKKMRERYTHHKPTTWSNIATKSPATTQKLLPQPIAKAKVVGIGFYPNLTHPIFFTHDMSNNTQSFGSVHLWVWPSLLGGSEVLMIVSMPEVLNDHIPFEDVILVDCAACACCLELSKEFWIWIIYRDLNH